MVMYIFTAGLAYELAVNRLPVFAAVCTPNLQ
jgi:hypothetical protein